MYNVQKNSNMQAPMVLASWTKSDRLCPVSRRVQCFQNYIFNDHYYIYFARSLALEFLSDMLFRAALTLVKENSMAPHKRTASIERTLARTHAHEMKNILFPLCSLGSECCIISLTFPADSFKFYIYSISI